MGLELGPLLNYVGVIPLCVLAIWAYTKEWIVPGKRFRRMEAERDRWQDIALEAIQASKTAIVPAAEAVQALTQRLPDPGADDTAGSGP